MQTTNTPIACLLGSNRFEERSAWIRRLAYKHLRAASRTHLSLHLTYTSAAAAQVRQLVAREQACCPFLHFDLREGAATVHVVVTAPEEAREAADLLFAHFAPEAATQPQSCC